MPCTSCRASAPSAAMAAGGAAAGGSGAPPREAAAPEPDACSAATAVSSCSESIAARGPPCRSGRRGSVRALTGACGAAGCAQAPAKREGPASPPPSPAAARASPPRLPPLVLNDAAAASDPATARASLPLPLPPPPPSPSVGLSIDDAAMCSAGAATARRNGRFMPVSSRPCS
eukprot:364312-Chlamydomonas_euryale.AAC.3